MIATIPVRDQLATARQPALAVAVAAVAFVGAELASARFSPAASFGTPRNRGPRLLTSPSGAKQLSPGRKPGVRLPISRQPQRGDTIFARASAFDRSRGDALT
jgi:hypothetical protein